tara:strand:+ start:218 stop:772 length:555 start_codon:yes stop_codon:yes gene_type:complete
MNEMSKNESKTVAVYSSGGSKGGRPSVMTPDVQKAILKAVSSGMPIKHAAQKVGIGQSSLYRLTESSEGFREGLAIARAEFLNRHVSNIERIASEQDGNNSAHSLRASMFLLERCFPNEFAQRKHVEIDQTVTENRTLSVNVLDSGEIVKDALAVLRSKVIPSPTPSPSDSTSPDSGPTPSNSV